MGYLDNQFGRKSNQEKWEKQVTGINPLLAGLEDKAVLRLEGNTEFQELDKGIGELVEEDLAVLGVAVNVLLEFLVLDKSQIAGQHHQGLGLVVSVLGGTVPLLPSPLLVNQETEEFVGENGRAEVPRTVVTGAVSVGTAERVSAAKSDHFAVIEAHAAEDGADVVLALGSIGETSVRSAGGNVTVLAAGSPGDGRSLHFLNGADAGEGPEITVADPREFLYNHISIDPDYTAHINMKENSPWTGSRKSRAIFNPALAPWSDSGANRMVAPLLPPVPVSLS